MARGRPKAAWVLTEVERAQLGSFARSRSLPSALDQYHFAHQARRRLHAPPDHDVVCGPRCAQRRGARRAQATPLHQEFLAFLRTIDRPVPIELDIHCIVDNYARLWRRRCSECLQGVKPAQNVQK